MSMTILRRLALILVLTFAVACSSATPTPAPVPTVSAVQMTSVPPTPANPTDVPPTFVIPTDVPPPTSAPTPTLLPTVVPATNTSVLPTNTPVPPPTSTLVPPTAVPTRVLTKPTATQPSANQYAAPTPLEPLAKNLHYQRKMESILFKWAPPAGMTSLGPNECYKLYLSSYKVNGPIFYADYFIVCDGTQFTLFGQGGADVELWGPFVPTPPETMEVHWTVSVVQVGAQLDKPSHRQNTSLSPVSAEAVFPLQTMAP